jgi:opacity protein-like surface antigen
MTARNVARAAGALILVSLCAARPAYADWALGVFLGSAHTQATSLTLNQPAEQTTLRFSSVRYDSESFKSPIYYGYRGAFFPRSGWLGIEGELIHLKVVADTSRATNARGTLRGETVDGTIPLSSAIERFSITHGVNLLLLNAVARKRTGIDTTGTPRWIFATRFGAGASIPHPESTIDGRHFEGYEWGAFSVQAAAGIEIRVVDRVYVSGEYKLTRTVQNVSVAAGTARTPLTTHHLAAGLTLALGASVTDRR